MYFLEYLARVFFWFLFLHLSHMFTYPHAQLSLGFSNVEFFSGTGEHIDNLGSRAIDQAPEGSSMVNKWAHLGFFSQGFL